MRYSLLGLMLNGAFVWYDTQMKIQGFLFVCLFVFNTMTLKSQARKLTVASSAS